MTEIGTPTFQDLEHPENPETAYAFGFKDYLAKISVDQANAAEYLRTVAEGTPWAGLSVTINAFGAFSGRTEFDALGHYDEYDDPRPGQTWFKNLPNVVVRPAEGGHSYYGSEGDTAPHSLEFSVNAHDITGRHLTLRHGILVINGLLDIPNAPELGGSYSSPRINEISLWTSNPIDRQGENGTPLASINVIRLDRVYASEPHPLDRPYD
jgi:hypothetical protein